MRTEIILDLGLYFIKNTNSNKDKDTLNDFLVFVDIFNLHNHYDCLTDSEYYIKNNKIRILSLDSVLKDNDLLEKIFLENEYSYDNFSVSTVKLLDEAIAIFDNDKKQIEEYLSKSIPSGTLPDFFTDEFYYCVLKQSKLPVEHIEYVVGEIKYHQYIYNTFAV